MIDINTQKVGDTVNISGVEISWFQSKFSGNMYEAMLKAAQNNSGKDSGNPFLIQEGIWNKELLLVCDIDNLNTLTSEIQKRFNFSSNKYNSEPIDESRQIPEIAGTFEYDGKGYIILFPRNVLTDETIPERGIYKGVIVNPELYFSKNTHDQVDDGTYRVIGILDGE